jgi:UDP-N-acetyl-D-glucosamine dehydrogenase
MKSLNFSARFIELATEINSAMPEHVADRIGDLLNDQRKAVNGAQVLILGVAYKRDVGDMRESPALDVVAHLARRGAEIRYHDPHVHEFEVDGRVYKGQELTDTTLAEADIAVILTDHSAVDYERIARLSRRVFDTRNATRDVTIGRENVTKL